MSVARHHAEWLSLLEISGPFLSMPVLLRVFPQGLDEVDAARKADLRNALADWEEHGVDPAIHRDWVRFVLEDLLEWPAELLVEGQAVPPGLEARVAEHGETLRPDRVLLDADDPARARLLVVQLPPDQRVERVLRGARWKASPATRMMELLRATGVPLGLVTDGEQWTLVHVPARAGDDDGHADRTATYVSFYASLWVDEPLTFRAWRSLLGTARFFGVPAEEILPALLDASADDQHELTDQLGLQVRHAVEVLIQAIDRVDADRNRELLAGVGEKRLYEAALTVMMRLVFLLYAEERHQLPLRTAHYAEHYAASTLLRQLHEAADRHGEDVLERRFAAWSRLLATFRAVHGGVRHENLLLPAYGGSLFDPDRYPFLEGRAAHTRWQDTAARPLAIHDRTVLHLLTALQELQVQVPGGGPAEARRLSFRALGVEQIGHVYESLLDHTAVRAAEPVLGLRGTKNREPEIPLSALEAARDRGDDALVKQLKQDTGRSPSALRTALSYEVPADDRRWSVVCEGSAELYERIAPWAGLVRDDSAGDPIVIPAGSVYVTEGTDRRTSGTHYTPRSLADAVVAGALEPLVYDGPADGKPRDAWTLHSPAALLDLKICDMAMGSGAFLVAASRFLAARLVEAWEALEADHPGQVIVTPEGRLSAASPVERVIPADADERLTLAQRLVVDRCLYGVDRNPLAVEMAKLSLWLVTLQQDRPFTFLDHALKPGDSLLGVTAGRQLERFHVDPGEGDQIALFGGRVQAAVGRARALRAELAGFTVENIDDAREKRRLHSEAQRATALVRQLGDLILAAAVRTAGGRKKALDDALFHYQYSLEQALELDGDEARDEAIEALLIEADAVLQKGRPDAQDPRRCFHWAVEFPEVFAPADGGHRGFDAIVGNPPFQGGQKITGALGTDYRNHLVAHLAAGRRGSADLCAYFFLRGAGLLREGGQLGLIATNTIAQGDTREVGLAALLDGGFSIPRAHPSQPWPGTANLEVALVLLCRGAWGGAFALEDEVVTGITSYLDRPGAVGGEPYRLKANAGLSFQGSNILGLGFTMSPEEAREWIAKDPRNADVLQPYLNGQDLNSHPEQQPSRWVINFRDWPLDRSAAGSWARADDKARKKYLQGGRVPADYPDPVAADYPAMLGIVREKVKPERDANKYSTTARLRWWLFERGRPELYSNTADLDRVLVRAAVSRTWAFCFVPQGWVYSHALIVIGSSSSAVFSTLQSFAHCVWSEKHASSMRNDLRYTPSDCFETFPFPERNRGLETIGSRYVQHRRGMSVSREFGLTKIAHLLDDRSIDDSDVVDLRDLQTALDLAVSNAYDWSDLDLEHGFHETKQGIRFTISERARREVLGRLLALNHERAREEREAEERAVPAKPGSNKRRKTAPKPRKPAPPDAQLTLLGGMPAPDPAPPSAQPDLQDRPDPVDTPATPPDDPTAAVLAALACAYHPLSRAELLADSGIDPTAWNRTIRALVDDGRVIRTGAKRGTRYQLPGTGNGEEDGR